MFTHFVQQGYLVAAINHTDGSASRVTLANGEKRMYEFPDVKTHGTRYRVNQVDKRERELEAMRAFLVESEGMPASCDT